MILTIYDLSGIQSFIFQTNKLKEMIGASVIVNQALFKTVPDCLQEHGEAVDDWAKNEFSFQEGDRAKIVYIGGGNALVAYGSKAVEKECTRKLQESIFEQTGGKLKLCSASIEANDAAPLSDNQKELLERLDASKRCAPEVYTAKGFSINEHDNTTFEPLLLFRPENDGALARCETRSQHLKNKMYCLVKAKAVPYFGGIGIDGVEFCDEFERFRKEGQKNYLAVIHIDGNTMGKLIREYVQSLDNLSLLEGLNRLAALSGEIGTAYREVLRDTIKSVYAARKSDDPIPFRPIICDGDDITAICQADDALIFVNTFLTRLSEKGLPSLEPGRDGTPIKLTAGAGVAFVKHGFPFHTAYEVAEQLCKNAKQKALALEGTKRGSLSSVDFHVCFGGVTDEIAEFRARNYTVGNTRLNLRPYVLGVSDNVHKDYDFEQGFLSTLDRIADFPKNKLKGLRNAYSLGAEVTQSYAAMIRARHIGEAKHKETAELLSEPYRNNEDGTMQARFFDALDILDFTPAHNRED